MDRSMNTHRKALVVALVTLFAVATAGISLASGPRLEPVVIVHGTVAATELPGVLVLQDGTRVELSQDRGLLFDGDPAAPAPGDDVVVVGRRSAASPSTIHSAGVVVRTPSGRQMPLPPDPCVAPSSPSFVFVPQRGRASRSVERAYPSSVASTTSQRDGMELSGMVLSVGAQSFQIQPEHGTVLDIFVDTATQWVDLQGLSDLEAGDTVRVRGNSMGFGFLATTVELISGAGGDGGGENSEIEGTVLSVGAQSFQIQPDSGSAIDVLVDASTRYMNLSSLAGLHPGDTVRVTGHDTGAGFLAAMVELMSGGGGGGGGENTEIEGTVLSVGAQSFQIQPESGSAIDVLVDTSTRYMNLSSLNDLHPGDTVRVTGHDTGAGFLAAMVELMSGGGAEGHGGVHMETTGLVTLLLPPNAFRLDDGRTYHVTASTVYENGLNRYTDLAPGQFVEVEGTYRGRMYTALKIELEGDVSGGQRFMDVEGIVTAVDASTLTVDGATTLQVTPATRFDGDADALGEIGTGWHVRARALLNMMGQLLAQEIRTRNPSPPTTENQEFERQQALAILTSTADPQTVAARHGAMVAGAVGDLGVLFQWNEELTDELLAQLNADPDVLAVEPNYHFRDPESSRKRFPVVDRSYTPAEFNQQPATGQVQLPAALAQADGTGTVVAIMDTGVEPCHPLIQDKLLPGGMDVVDGDLEPWETRNETDDDGDGLVDEAAGHGTFVASIIALAAPGAKILPYRVLDDDGGGTAYGLALALADAIDRNVDVINISLTYHARSSVVDLLLEKAAQRGIVVVAAAGNDPVDTLPFPAVDSHVLAVTALAADGTTLADFANTSTQPPIVAAPGEDVYGALDRGRYGWSTGTSMAAPFAAAGAALIKSLDSTIDPSLVEQALVQAGTTPSGGAWTGNTLDLSGALTLVGP